MRALYGFSPELPPFNGLTATQQVALLQSWGVTVVFGGYENIDFVEALHGIGLAVYAEFTCFAGKTLWERFPDCRPVTADGKLLEPLDWYYGANPSHPALRQDRLDALADLLRGYSLDGVWLDFIRWPCRWEKAQPICPQTSFDQQTIALFSRDTGIDIVGDNAAQSILTNHQTAWEDWRCEQIVSWVEQAHRLIRAIRPGAKLGLFGIPWQPEDHAGAIRSVVGQDFAILAPYIDVFSPMTYHAMVGRPTSWIADVSQALKVQTGKPVIPIIQSVDEPVSLTSDDYAASLSYASKADGVIVFTFKGVMESPDKLEKTIAAFSGEEGHDQIKD